MRGLDGIPRHDWTRPEIQALFELPFPDLIFHAQRIHRLHFDPREVQISTLLSIKTGGCPEDCAYCPQSAHYDTGVKADKLMEVDAVLAEARAARGGGGEPLLHGRGVALAPGSRPRGGLRHGRGRQGAGAGDLRDARHAHGAAGATAQGAGLDYYNHNLDTSPEFYGDIISTRLYRDRLDTLEHVRGAGIHVCCGGIVGMGEGRGDRIGMIATLASLPSHPESVPINLLVRVEGTPLAGQAALDPFEFVRTIAVARIAMPASVVRLSAGREDMSEETQALCFLAGANSIFYGPKLLTTANPDRGHDLALLDKLGLVPMR